MTIECDIAIIGSGPGGYVAAIRAAQLGFSTVCVEKSKSLGGTCLNVGCIPSKALLQTTEHLAFLNRHAADHGIEVDNVKINFPQMMRRKGEVVKGLTDGVAALFKNYKIKWVQGSAKLTGHHQIQVKNGKEEQTIAARNIILASGSEAIPLPFLPFDEKVIVSSTGALELPEIPKKLIVIGGGVIGVELASVYSRLGSEVTVVEMLDAICTVMDKVISRQLLQILKKQGIQFYLGAKVTKADQNSKKVSLTVQSEGKDLKLDGNVVLVSVGRRPYTSGLGLENIGIKPNSKGFIPVDGNFRTSVPSIYAIGDLVEGPMLAHKASEEGIAAVDIIAGKKAHINYQAIPNIIYTSPEVAAVGLTEQEAREAGLSLLIGQCFYKAVARARASGETDGLVKIIGEATTGRLIGMHIVGACASEIIAEGMLAIEKKATVKDLAYSPQGHPTYGEAVKEAALQALSEAIHI